MVTGDHGFTQMDMTTLPQVLGFAWSHWRRYPLALCGLGAVLTVTLATQVLQPVFAGRIIDAIALQMDGQDALRAAIYAFAVFVGLAVLGRIAFHIGLRIWIRLATSIMERLARDAFVRVQRFSTDWHANNFAGSTVRKISRGMWAFDDLGDSIYLGLIPALLIVSGLTIMLAYHWPLIGLTLALTLVLYVSASAALATYFVAPANRRAVQQDSELGAILADAVACNAVVKAFAAEKREEARFSHATDKWLHLTRRSWRRHENMDAVQTFLSLAMQASLIGLVLWFWSRGDATPGQVTLVITSFFLIEGYIKDLGYHVRTLQQAVNDIEDIVAFESAPLEVEDQPGAVELKPDRGEILFDRVGFTYANQTNALYKDFCLRIAPGERIALVGESGSGKSTFVKLMQRLYDLEAGRILIDGQDVLAVTQSSLRQTISIVPQEPILFHRSLSENIAYCRPGASKEEVVRAAKQAHAHAFISSLPQGYDTLVGERGVKLSGGERQRVAIARAFIADAPILVLDEATSSLDSVTEAEIQSAIGALMEGRTTILIAHRLSTIRKVDRILVFSKGSIVEQGTHESLATKPDGVYRRLLETQRDQMI